MLITHSKDIDGRQSIASTLNSDATECHENQASLDGEYLAMTVVSIPSQVVRAEKQANESWQQPCTPRMRRDQLARTSRVADT